MNKAIFWDFDGTLSCTNRSFFSALHTAISGCGYFIEQERITDFLKRTYSWRTPDILYPNETGKKWWDALFGKINLFCAENGVAEADFEKINTCFKELLIDVKNYCLYDDAIETLRKCTELGYKNYIATNNYPEIVENFEKLGISQFMSGYAVSSLIGCEKPRAEFYDYAKKLSGNPEMLYMVGDNPIADIRGGNSAGFITVAVHACKDSEAEYYFEKLMDIPEMLNFTR